jgi:hypothetical protein
MAKVLLGSYDKQEDAIRKANKIKDYARKNPDRGWSNVVVRKENGKYCVLADR